MKEIHLAIEDAVFKELESSVVVKKMTSSFYGTTDEFAFLVVKSIKEGRKSVTIERKKSAHKKSKVKKHKQ